MQAVVEKTEWMSLAAAARHVDRTVEDLLAVEGRLTYKQGFPQRRWVNGRPAVNRAEFEAWAVGTGLVTPDGDPLVSYEDIATLLDVAVQTVRIWERDRKANLVTHGSADVTDIPDPVHAFYRVMYRKQEILHWDRTIRRRATGRYRKKFRPRT